MTPSGACAALIERFEACRLTAYLPTPNDHWTIGWGETGPGIGAGTVWTRAEADARFAARLAAFGAGVDSALAGPTTQARFDAMTSLAWNIGLGAFAASTLLRLHNAGDFAAVPAQFARWDS
jgi:lysozyme